MISAPSDRRVGCPYCGAEVGARCRSAGDFVNWNHAVRITEAANLDGEEVMANVKCDECKGTGYWSNYPPKPGEPLDMMDCCGVCCGKGHLTPEEVAEIARDYVPVVHSSSLAAKVEALCEGAIENHCRMLEAGNGCEDYGRDVADWCSVCLLVHDLRKLVAGQFTRADQTTEKKA